MKFIHISDLHIGKRVNGFSMIEDQEFILKQILGIVDDEKPDCVFIAGDVYDRTVPSAEAVELFDDFLVRLSARSLDVFIISGNHDSPERLAFGNRLMDGSGIHISPVYAGEVAPYETEDEYGPLCIYMLPFIKPADVRRHFPDNEISSYTDALAAAISVMNIDKSKRNVLITHQFVTGAERSESEEISVGGADNVDATVFEGFDYIALGHIHGPQNISKAGELPVIRYCGTPLKYSFSETKHKKSVTVVQMKEKGVIDVSAVPLLPKRDMCEIKGTYDELMAKSFYDGTTYGEDYMHVILTDEEDIPDAIGKLRGVYRNIMKLDYDNTRTRHSTEITGDDEIEIKTPVELFAELYEQQNGLPMTDIQSGFVEKLAEEIWEGGS